jgi:hypothetical protein
MTAKGSVNSPMDVFPKDVRLPPNLGAWTGGQLLRHAAGAVIEIEFCSDE